MQHELTMILAWTGFVSVVVSLVLLVIVVIGCMAFYNRDEQQSTTRFDQATEFGKAREAMEDMAGIHEVNAAAESAADKVTRAMADAYNYGMSVCAEIKATRGLSVMPVWTADDFYRHRMSHEVAASRANPNMDGATLAKAVDARVCDDLWHQAPKASEPPVDTNVTRRIDKDPNIRQRSAKPDWRDVNVANENGYVPGDQQEQTPNGVAPRKPADAREAMMFGGNAEE